MPYDLTELGSSTWKLMPAAHVPAMTIVGGLHVCPFTLSSPFQRGSVLQVRTHPSLPSGPNLWDR